MLKQLIIKLASKYVKAAFISHVQSCEWEKDDAENLNSFLRSKTGRRLEAILEHSIILGNAEACQTENVNADWRRGIAFGRTDQYLKLKTLGVVAKEEKTELSNDELDELVNHRIRGNFHSEHELG